MHGCILLNFKLVPECQVLYVLQASACIQDEHGHQRFNQFENQSVPEAKVLSPLRPSVQSMCTDEWVSMVWRGAVHLEPAVQHQKAVVY